jgi:hypothetical protein
MAVERLLPILEAAELIALTLDVANNFLTSIVDAHEKAETYPGASSLSWARRAC